MNILKLISLIAVANFVLYAFPAQSMEGSGFGEKTLFVPGEIIVKMKPAVNLNATALGLQTKDKLTSGGEIIYRIQPSIMGALSETQARDRTLETVEKLKQQPGVEYAQPNYIFHIMKTPNDPLYPKQWHYFNYGSGTGESLGGIDLPKVWDTNTGSQNVVVAVIDTGILPNHEDVAGSSNLIPGYDMISDSSKSNDGDGRDSDATDAGDAMKKGECFFGMFPEKDTLSSWHGSHVAGTIGVGKTNNTLGIAGINWNVKVQAVRVLGKCGGTTSDINDGIRWAAGLNVPGVPINTTPAKVINMSLGGEQSCTSATQQAINDAVNAGTTVVVAAGNSGKDVAGFEPAGCDNVITVAAADPQGKLTSYSNFGSAVEIMAPGGDTERGCVNPEDGVLSIVQTSSDRGNCGVPNAYAYYNGTSMASPHVAGVAALWLAADSSLTPSTILTELQAVARPRNSTECSKPCGAGLMSAMRTDVVEEEFSLTFDPDKPSYQLNDTTAARATLKISGTPQSGKTVTFSSDNASVATISPSTAVTDSQGQAETTVSASGQGKAVITAEAEGKNAQKNFTVQTETANIVLTMKFDPDKPTYALGETISAQATAMMNGTPQAGKTVKFSSSNPNVASVSPDTSETNAAGVAKTNVTIVSETGEANIIAEIDSKKVQKTVTVPDLSWTSFVLLLMSIIGISLIRTRKLSSGISKG